MSYHIIIILIINLVINICIMLINMIQRLVESQAAQVSEEREPDEMAVM